jgi:hypothetical protein
MKWVNKVHIFIYKVLITLKHKPLFHTANTHVKVVGNNKVN